MDNLWKIVENPAQNSASFPRFPKGFSSSLSPFLKPCSFPLRVPSLSPVFHWNIRNLSLHNSLLGNTLGHALRFFPQPRLAYNMKMSFF